MPGLILKSPYIQCGKNGKSISGYMKYIATRERVELLPDDSPPTQRQIEFVQKLVQDFPDSKELTEYEDYLAQPTKYLASAFIHTALECNWSDAAESDVYMKYIATRPRVEKLGSHGLFGDEDAVSLGKTMDELDSYSRPTGALNSAMAAYEKRMISSTITAAFHSYRGRCAG